MKAIRFDPADFDAALRARWVKWQVRAAKATADCQAARANGEPCNFERDRVVWTELKRILLDGPFRGKCGYCESSIGVTDYGDADHYRPKGSVTVCRDGGTVVVQCEEAGEPHPGYYWLAFNPRNLVPSCEQCNRAGGKMEQFPTRNGSLCRDSLDPDDLDEAEGPLLLNPYKDDPNTVLRFGDKGTVVAIDGDERGETSIKVYHLDRPELNDARFLTQKLAWLEVSAKFNGGDLIGARELSESFRDGTHPHSLAVDGYLRLRHAEQGEALFGPA